MKRLMGSILALVSVLAMAGCNNKSMDYIISSKPNVTGIVEEVRNDYIIMYSDSAEGYPNGSRWSISLEVENKDSYTDLVVGDEIVVYHDGNVMETEPLKVGTVYAITLKTPAERVDKEAQENATEILGEEENDVESIQDEIARVEEQSREHCDIDSSNMGQQEMNYHSTQWYKLWDDELNSLWSRLSDELDAETKAKVLEEQRAWIKRKEGNATAAGMQALGGSLQPLLESETAAEMTRARVYVLAGYLAEVRNESFTISPEIQESLDAAELNLDDIFAQFEGQWIFDESRGACVGVERTENSAYGVEGSNWTVWVTGGDLFSDLHVHGYTEQNILFKLPQDVYYELSFSMDDQLLLTYRPSLEPSAFNDFDTIVCNSPMENEETDYSGMYTDTQGTDSIYSELILVKQEDGSYVFSMGIYRLTTIDGTAIQEGDVLHFVGMDASGEPIEGDIVISGETAEATFTDSTWAHIKNGEVFTFPNGKLEMDEIPEEYLELYLNY